MTIFSVHHTTTCIKMQSDRAFTNSCFVPATVSTRDCSIRLEITPAPTEIRWIHDPFGKCITLVDFNAITTLLQFDTVIRLDHMPENAPDFRIEDYARTHPFCYANEELPDLAPYIRRHRCLGPGIDIVSCLRRIGMRALAGGEGTDRRSILCNAGP